MSRTQSISSIRTYQKCPQRYHWRYVEGLTEDETPDMQRGSVFHAGMEGALRAALQPNVDVLRAGILDARSYALKHGIDDAIVTPVVEMLKYHITRLGIGTEVMPYIHKGEPVIEFEFDVVGNSVAFRGKVDAVVVLSDGRKVLVDWKSRKTSESFYTAYALAVDSQLFAYAGALRHGHGIHVDAIAQVQMSAQLPAVPQVKKDKDGTRADDYSVQMGKTTAAVLSPAISHLSDDEREALVLRLFERKKIEAEDYFLAWAWLDPQDETVILRQTLAQAAVVNADTRLLPVLDAFKCKTCPFLRNCREKYLAPKLDANLAAVIADDEDFE